MSCHLSWAMEVNARPLSHKNGPAGQLMVVEKVRVRMAGTVDDLMLTLRCGAEARSLRGD
jgi:hypothetical protein